MSSRVRRMALGLATLTLLTSLFLVAQGFLNAPEALASCPERTWCDPPFLAERAGCCCLAHARSAMLLQTCYWQEYDCTINWDNIKLDDGCIGSYCYCIWE